MVDCYLEYWGLALALRRIAKERNEPEEPEIFSDLGGKSLVRDPKAIEQHIKDMISRHGLDPQIPFSHFQFTTPRV